MYHSVTATAYPCQVAILKRKEAYQTLCLVRLFYAVIVVTNLTLFIWLGLDYIMRTQKKD